MIYKSRISKWIASGYGLLVLFIGGIFTLAPFLEKDMSIWERNLLTIVFFIIAIIFIWIFKRAYNMEFKISQGKLTIRGVFKTHNIPLTDIEKCGRSPIPFGIRIFGASGLGGWYYLPGIGRTWVSMGNFSDGVLIITKNQKRFVITPMNPDKFVNEIKNQKQI